MSLSPKKWVWNTLKTTLSELLGKHVTPDKQAEIMADLEKHRLSAFSGVFERGGILHLFYVYSALVIFRHIVAPCLAAFFNVQIYVEPIPEELTYLVFALGSIILGKKHLDKKLPK